MGRNACRLGVLALQGDFSAHIGALERAGLPAREVRRPAGLEGLDGLILPGGESTTHLLLMEERGFPEALRSFARRGGALFGTCAGAILLSRRITAPDQAGLGLLDIEVQRNAYGRQGESFETSCQATAFPGEPLEMVFIRAPRITSMGPGVRVLADLDGEPVLVREGRVMAATFHPELSTDTRVHACFAEMAAGLVEAAS